MSQPKIQPLQGGAYMHFARKKLSIWPGKHLTILDVQHDENGTISPASHCIYHIILLKLQWSTSRTSRTSRSLTSQKGLAIMYGGGNTSAQSRSRSACASCW